MSETKNNNRDLFVADGKTALEMINILREDEGENITWTIDRIEALEYLENYVKYHEFNNYVDNLINIQEQQDETARKHEESVVNVINEYWEINEMIGELSALQFLQKKDLPEINKIFLEDFIHWNNEYVELETENALENYVYCKERFHKHIKELEVEHGTKDNNL